MPESDEMSDLTAGNKLESKPLKGGLYSGLFKVWDEGVGFRLSQTPSRGGYIGDYYREY